MTEAKRPRVAAPPAPPLLVYHHGDTQLHDTALPGVPHQEGADRVSAIRAELRGVELREVAMARPPRESLLTVHTEPYLARLEELGRDGDDRVRPLTPLLLAGSGGEADTDAPSMTNFSRGTLPAAMRAAASVVEAIDATTAAARSAGGGSERAFCLVRPPGHHATPVGLDANAGGCGFCMLGNVAVGAAHAIRAHGHRVAIVDFDVHHGNGTEQVLAVLTALAALAASGADGGGAEAAELCFCSLHLHEVFEDSDLDYFPGSGADAGGGGGGGVTIVNVPIRPLWSRFPSHYRDGDVPKDASELMGRAGWMRGLRERVLPAVRAFRPTLLLLSAGFDGAAGDDGCVQRGEDNVDRAGLDLAPEDFRSMTTELLRAVEYEDAPAPAGEGGGGVSSAAPVRCAVVSVLEGGYGCCDDREASGYDRSCLVRACAAQVSALARVYM